MVRDCLIIGGINTTDFDIHVSREDTFLFPERDVTFIEVPGRNGDLIKDNGRWKNVDIPYHFFCFDKEKYLAFMRKIINLRGYVKIVDSEKPDEYRLGVFSAQVQPTVTNVNNKSFSWDLVFNCKPQRFLETIEKEYDLINNASVPTLKEYYFFEESEIYIDYIVEMDVYSDSPTGFAFRVDNPDGSYIYANFTIVNYDKNVNTKVVYEPKNGICTIVSANKNAHMGSFGFNFMDVDGNYITEDKNPYVYIQNGATFSRVENEKCKIKIIETRWTI